MPDKTRKARRSKAKSREGENKNDCAWDRPIFDGYWPVCS
jgi:hypothetical protein